MESQVMGRRHGLAPKPVAVRSRGDASHKFPTTIPFRCTCSGHDYVGSLSCPYFRLAWLDFERDRIAQVGATPAKAEKVRVHSPLGNMADLARHLILWALAVPA